MNDEEIEKEAEKYAGDCYGIPDGTMSMQSETVFIEFSASKEDFKAGAKWSRDTQLEPLLLEMVEIAREGDVEYSGYETQGDEMFFKHEDCLAELKRRKGWG